MLPFVIGVLTFFMVVDCVVLVLLVLVQLPKKEAGAGLAFGGAASDALFGAGSGNVLTKITKYAATVFFILAIVLSIMQAQQSRNSSGFMKRLSTPGAAPTRPVLPPTTPNPQATPPATAQPGTAPARPGTNALLSPALEDTNVPAPARATTNPPAAAPPATTK